MTKYFLRSLIDWLFRRRSIGLRLTRIGAGLFVVALVGLSVGITVPTKDGPFIFSWDSSGGAAVLTWAVFLIATALVVIGLVLIARDVRLENRKKVIVIEARGLREWAGEPLENAISPAVKGRRDAFTVDVRQGIVDGQIVSPARALERLSGLPDDISRRASGVDRSDVTFALGGLAPVPLLFLLGVIVDDEHKTILMDWDRKSQMWRTLDDEDDGKRFAIAGLSGIHKTDSRAVLAVSASYDVFDDDIRLVEPSAPIIRLDLADRSTASHWSEEKQQALAQQFLDTTMDLGRRGISEISLFLAAPASLSIRLGTIYDKRNLPKLLVNQYENGHPLKFPWAVNMPVAGRFRPELIQR
ncbi:SAVED domain-containing protein [Erythrobacter sp. R86502]|uniref:SAVED domain-containing protein n=1 Tax=Erythrobacter sp. R86502 TaxID=3093846 RepID=UPI0036D295B3